MRNENRKEYDNERSDALAKNLFRKVFPVLAFGIQHSNKFFSHSLETPYHPLTKVECALWNDIYGLEGTILKDQGEGRLFVTDLNPSTGSMLEGERLSSKNTKSISDSLMPLGGKRVRINFGEGINEGNITPFNPECMQFYVCPQFHLGGSFLGSNRLYNAFIALSFLVTDRNNRFALKYIEGTGVANWMGLPVYSYYHPLAPSMWFNTEINPSERNTCEVSISNKSSYMLSANLHSREQIETMDVPRDEKTKLFLWQITQFIKRENLLPQIDSVIEDKKSKALTN